LLDSFLPLILAGEGVFFFNHAASLPAVVCSIRARMASTRQAVQRSDNFTGLGKRPAFTPAHQVDFETGMIAGLPSRVLPTMSAKRK
jgi:hypothetical protein